MQQTSNKPYTEQDERNEYLINEWKVYFASNPTTEERTTSIIGNRSTTPIVHSELQDVEIHEPLLDTEIQQSSSELSTEDTIKNIIPNNLVIQQFFIREYHSEPTALLIKHITIAKKDFDRNNLPFSTASQIGLNNYATLRTWIEENIVPHLNGDINAAEDFLERLKTITFFSNIRQQNIEIQYSDEYNTTENQTTENQTTKGLIENLKSLMGSMNTTEFSINIDRIKTILISNINRTTLAMKKIKQPDEIPAYQRVLVILLSSLISCELASTGYPLIIDNYNLKQNLLIGGIISVASSTLSLTIDNMLRHLKPSLRNTAAISSSVSLIISSFIWLSIQKIISPENASKKQYNFMTMAEAVTYILGCGLFYLAYQSANESPDHSHGANTLFKSRCLSDNQPSGNSVEALDEGMAAAYLQTI